MGKRLSNLLSVLLVIVLMVQMLPMQVFAIESTESADEPMPIVGAEAAIPEEAEVTVESEITELREAEASTLCITMPTEQITISPKPQRTPIRTRTVSV